MVELVLYTRPGLSASTDTRGLRDSFGINGSTMDLTMANRCKSREDFYS